MSFDLGVWYPHQRVSDAEATEIYTALCEGRPTALKPHPAVTAFYEALVARHPELDDVPADRLDDHAFSPWSCAHDRSEMHVIMAAVWPQADNVFATVSALAVRHQLALYNPQEGTITFPDGSSGTPPRPWWRFW